MVRGGALAAQFRGRSQASYRLEVRGEEAGNKKLGHAKHIRVFVFSERRKAPTV